MGTRTLPDLLLGIVGGAMVVAALLLLLFGGAGDSGAVSDVRAPALEVIAPAAGATVEGVLEVRFRSDASLGRMPGGWGTGELHLHAELGGREVMPGAADIRREPDGSYSWAIGRPGPGGHTFRLFWSDADHRPLLQSATEPITVRVR
jgi:hypothetical protein